MHSRLFDELPDLASIPFMLSAQAEKEAQLREADAQRGEQGGTKEVEYTVPIIHKLLVKSIEESKDGDFELIGTIIHHQIGAQESREEKDRFNFR